MSTPVDLVYFSSTSENTHRFIQQLAAAADYEICPTRLPLLTSERTHMATAPYVLVVPTYGAAGKGYVPKQVIKFLNVESNRAKCLGVIGAGNTNFGADYCKAGDIVAAKLGVPHLYRFELMGTDLDIARVAQGLELFCTQKSPTPTP